MVCWARRNKKAEEGADITAGEHVDAQKPSEADVKADAAPVEGQPLDTEVVDIVVDGETPKPIVEEPKDEGPQAGLAEVPTAEAPKKDDTKSTGSKKSFLTRMSGRFTKKTSKESSKPKKQPTAEVKEETPEQDGESPNGEAQTADAEGAGEEKPKDENEEKQEEKPAEEEKKVEE